MTMATPEVRIRGGVVITPTTFWECPNCTFEDATHEARAHTRFHNCNSPRGRGMSLPMVPKGTRCKIELLDREDYVGKELVQTDAFGRPVMSAVVTRDDGVDTAVYAPTARGSFRDEE